MKFSYLTLIAAAVVVGCSKSAPTGTVASNAPTDAQGSTTSTGSPPTAPSTNPATPSGSTATSTTGSTGAMSPTPGATTPPGAPPVPGKAAPTSPTAPPAAPPGAAAVPGGQGAPPQLSPDQQKAREAQIAEMTKRRKENAEKADKATKSSIEGVSGTYIGFIDEARITPAMRKQPNFDQNLAKAKEEVKKASATIAANGDVIVKGMGPDPVTGFTTKIDGKPAFVFLIPKPQPGMPPKQFAPVQVKNSGAIIVIGGFAFKKA